MKSTLKVAFAPAAVLVAVASIACGPVAVAPSTEPSPSQQAARISVAGSSLQLTADLPEGWAAFDFGARRGTSAPPAGMAFIVSVVDNTFEDPCRHVQRSPKIGPTVADLATALGAVPNTTATDPVRATIAGQKATYIELGIPASLPCQPDQFYLWQDSPDGYWWVQGLNETARVWILDVGGQRVAILAHSYPGSGEAAKAELQRILDSIVFDSGS